MASVALLAMLLACQTGAVLVQVTGWTNMMLRFSNEGDWEQAVERTFSGAEPCAFCTLASAIRSHGDEDAGRTTLQERPAASWSLLATVEANSLKLPKPDSQSRPCVELCLQPISPWLEADALPG